MKVVDGSNSAMDRLEAAVGGRYRLLALVDEGGMGRVWRATDQLLSREVAVKEIASPDGMAASRTAELQLQAVHEAQAAARIDHPNVVRVFDVVQTPGRSWIVMEYIPSRSLHDVVQQDGPLAHRQAARIGLGVLAALRAAHRAGVLHRDVKPRNVLIADDGRVVLSDFGLALLKGQDVDSGSGPLLGSPHFVAPERVRSGVSSEQSDLWSFGATLYAVVEGRAPYARATAQESLAAVAVGLPDPVHRPGPLHPIIAGLLSRDPARRPTAADVELSLQQVLTRAVGVVAVPGQRRPDAAVAFRPGNVAPITPPPSEPQQPMGPVPASRPVRHTRVVVAGVAALLAGLVGVGVTIADRAARDDRTSNGGTAVTSSSTAPGGIARTCEGADGEESTLSSSNLIGEQPYALPTGWLWHRDPAGFRLPVPVGWSRSTDGGSVCFRDPDGIREFSVDRKAPVTRHPLDHWQREEPSLLAAGALPGYERISMGLVLLQKGGADWEYTWQPGSEQRLHVRRLLLSTAPQRAFVLRWTTRDTDWSLNEPVQRRIVSGFTDLR